MSLNRPQLQKRRTIVQQQLVCGVIIYDQDRLSRQLAHQLLLTEEFEQAGIPLYVLSMPVTEKTPEAQLFSNMRGVFAEFERAKILERTKRGLYGRVKCGFPPGSNVPLGYVYIKDTDRGGRYKSDPKEAALVQRIFQMYVESGLSMAAIAEHLTQERVPSQSDRRANGSSRKMRVGTWQPSSILLILTNETYIGTLYYGKMENYASPNNPDKKTRHRLKPKEER